MHKSTQAKGNDKEGTSSLSPPERRREKIEIGSFLKGLCVEVAIGKTTIFRGQTLSDSPFVKGENLS